MYRLHIDFETFSEVNIRKVTTSYYTSHPSTEVLMLGWAVEDDDPEIWIPEIGKPAPYLLIKSLHDPDCLIYAYNAPFERGLLKHKLGKDIPIERFQDTMVEAFCLAFPAGLDRVLEAIGLQKKDPRGKKLIDRFSKPAPSNHLVDRYTPENKPEEWEEFKQYCIKDVKVERSLHLWLKQFHTMSKNEIYLWFLDQKINDRGVPVDIEMAKGALKLWEMEKADIVQELRELTGLNPVTRIPFLGWLKDHGCLLPNTQKEVVQAAISEQLDRSDRQSTITHRALTLWGYKEVRALDKYKTIIGTSENGLLHGLFQYGGASRTLRWAGRTFQPHNLKKTIVNVEDIKCLSEVITDYNRDMMKAFWPEYPPSELLGSAIRHAIRATPKKTFAIADLAGIESRVLAWLTNCKKMLTIFQENKDTYKAFAADYFRIPYNEVTKQQRGFSKPPVLGAGYGLGEIGLVAYAKGYGVDLTFEESQRMVDVFRSSYSEVPTFWKWIDGALKHVTTTGKHVRGYRLVIDIQGPFLRILLPSGRWLWYFQPKVLMHTTPWGEDKPTFSYMGVHKKTSKWVRLFAHGGLITENCIQAIARDLLAYGMVLADKNKLDIFLHVHDEIGIESEVSQAEKELDILIKCMTTRPHWAPDLLLGAEGYVATRYRKD